MMFAALLLIFFVAFGLYVSVTSPTPAPPKDRRVWDDFSIIDLAILSSDVYKYSCWVHALIEMLILVLPNVVQQSPPYATIPRLNITFFDFFLPLPLGGTTIFFPPLRILGAFLVLSGGTIRYMCFRELGRHFTFHVALLKNHTLVTTGPYSMVRHPSYSALVISGIGSTLWHTTSGSWLRQSGFYTNPVAWVVFLPAIITILGTSMILGMVVRPKIEDELLKKEFGKEWDEWAKRVPYRVLPGIY